MNPDVPSALVRADPARSITPFHHPIMASVLIVSASAMSGPSRYPVQPKCDAIPSVALTQGTLTCGTHGPLYKMHGPFSNAGVVSLPPTQRSIPKVGLQVDRRPHGYIIPFVWKALAIINRAASQFV